MKRLPLTLIAASLALGLAANSAFAQSLTDLYESARNYDATFQSLRKA